MTRKRYFARNAVLIPCSMKKALKYGFCKKYFDRNEPLNSADLEKNGGQKCSTGQRFIFSEVLLMKSIL